MRYLLIIPLCLLAVSKITIQSSFSKNYVQKPVDALTFNALIFLSATILSAPTLFHGIPLQNIAWGSAFGLFSVLFQLFYCFALRYGSVSITVLIVNCSMVIPVCISVVLFHEPLTVFHVIGILFILMTFLLNTERQKNHTYSISWVIFLVLAFIANSGCNVVQKLYTKYTSSSDNSGFVAAAYLCAVMISVLILIIMYSQKSMPSFSFSPKVYITALSIGCILFIFQLLNTYAISRIDGTILFPVYNGGTTLLSTLCGCILFHEKLSTKQITGIVSGIIGIIFMCL